MAAPSATNSPKLRKNAFYLTDLTRNIRFALTP